MLQILSVNTEAATLDRSPGQPVLVRDPAEVQGQAGLPFLLALEWLVAALSISLDPIAKLVALFGISHGPKASVSLRS